MPSVARMRASTLGMMLDTLFGVDALAGRAPEDA
jgi:hypothetical protein